MGKFKRIKTKCFSVITALVILLTPLTLPVNAVTTASEAVSADETAVTYSTVPTVHVLTHTFGGLSVLLEYNGHFGLIDSGEDKDSPATDSGYWHTGTTGTLSKASEDYSIPYFKSLGVTKDNFDFFIGTHPHSDHIGAADEIIREFRPKKVYLQEYSDSYIIDPGPDVASNPLWDNRYVYDRTIAAARAVGAELIQDLTAQENHEFYLGPDGDTTMKIEIKNYGDDYKYKPTNDANDFSLGVLVTANNKKMFISGDINNFGGDEDKLATELGDIDALVLGHHGNYGSNSYNYVTTLNPELMIIPGTFKHVSEKGILYDKGLLETLWYMGTKNNPSNPSKLFATSWMEEKGYDSLDVFLNSDGVTTNVPSGFEYFATTTMANGIEVGINYKDGIPCKYNGDTATGKGEIQYDGKRFIREYDNGFYMTGEWEGNNYTEGDANAWKFRSTITNQCVTGINYIYGSWYCFNKTDGEILTGWRQDAGYYYYFGPDGKMRYGRNKIGDYEYYFALDGKMMTGWVTIDRNSYFFYPHNYNNDPNIPEGAMAKDTLVGTNQYVNSSGEYEEAIWPGDKTVTVGGVQLLGGWVIWNDGYYYIDPDTHTYVTGWKNIDGKDYYFSDGNIQGYSTGQMVTGPCWTTYNGEKKLYYFSTGTELRPEPIKSDDDITEGKIQYNADVSQLTTKGCEIKKSHCGDLWILSKDGKWYILNDDDTLTTGWRPITDKQENTTYYYFDENTGEMQIGLTKITTTNENGEEVINYYYLRRKGDVGIEGSKVTDVGTFSTAYGKSYYVTNTDGVIYTSGTGLQNIQYTDGKTYKYYFYDDHSLAKGLTKIGNEFYYFVNDGEAGLLGQPVGSLVEHKTTEDLGDTVVHTIDNDENFIRSLDGNVYYIYGDGVRKDKNNNTIAANRLFDESLVIESWGGWMYLGDSQHNTLRYYFFDDLAEMQTGFVQTSVITDEQTVIKDYYLVKKKDETITVGGNTFTEGQMVYGGRFKASDGHNYFANNHNIFSNLLTGVREYEGNYYYFINGGETLPDGATANTADKYKQVTAQGWITDASGNKYYVKQDGTLAIGATEIDNEWFYFRAGDETVVPVDPTKTPVCALVTTTGWIEIKNEKDPYKYTRYYVFGPGTNNYSEGRLFDASMSEPLKVDKTKSWDSWLPLYVTENNKENLEFYRFDENAKMLKGFVDGGGELGKENKYYLDPEGKIKINGVKFKKGQMVYGGKFIVGDDYYYANGNNDNNLYGNLLTGVRTDVDGKNYYFQTGTEQQLPDGSTASTDNKYKQVTAKGWVLTERGNWYYIDGNGVCYPSSKGLTISNNVLENNTENSLNDKEKSVYNFKISRTDGEALTSRELECSSVQRSAKTVEKDGTFTLSAGESVTFTGLVSDKEYYVESLNTDKSWIISTKYSTDGTNYSDGTSVEITANESEMQNITFKNYIDVLEVTLNYYDRSVENGLPSDISSKPTTFTKTYVGAELYENGIHKDIASMIVNSAVTLDSKRPIDNIVDTYIIWGTQQNAVDVIKTFDNPHTNQKYTGTGYHTDRYGNEPDLGEKWITYYGANGQEIKDESTATDNPQNVYSVNVWLYNEPREYRVTAYQASSSDHLTDKGNGVYVASSESNKFTDTAYYNQRLGKEYSPTVDESTNHLAKYGIPGYTGNSLETAKTIVNNGSTLTFSHWAFDPDGKEIASTDIKYNYRVTNELKLYAVYTGTLNENPGLTVSKNNPDVYVDKDGTSKTRLNTIMNPYNCSDCDDKIEQASIVYVIYNESTALSETDISTIRKGIKSILDNDKNDDGKVSGTVKVVNVDKTATGFTYHVQPADGDKDSKTYIKLTNKNRLQFSTTFTTSALNGKRLLAFAGMKYNDTYKDAEGNPKPYNWIVSDNCIDYNYLNS